MDRREFLARSATTTLGLSLEHGRLNDVRVGDSVLEQVSGASTISPANVKHVLDGTQPLTVEGDLAAQMVGGIHQYLLGDTEAQKTKREQLWRRDYSSVEHYQRSVETNRQRFRRL